MKATEAGEFAGTVAWDPLWTGGMGLAIPYAVATGKVDIAKEPKEHREFYGTGIIVTKANVAEVKKGGGALDFSPWRYREMLAPATLTQRVAAAVDSGYR